MENFTVTADGLVYDVIMMSSDVIISDVIISDVVISDVTFKMSYSATVTIDDVLNIHYIVYHWHTCLCESLKYAGTVTTAFFIGCPR